MTDFNKNSNYYDKTNYNMVNDTKKQNTFLNATNTYNYYFKNLNEKSNDNNNRAKDLNKIKYQNDLLQQIEEKRNHKEKMKKLQQEEDRAEEEKYSKHM